MSLLMVLMSDLFEFLESAEIVLQGVYLGLAAYLAYWLGAVVVRRLVFNMEAAKRMKMECEEMEQPVPPKPQGDLFFTLPKEMKLRIFSYLTRHERMTTAALVCKSWRELSEDASFWRDVRLDGRKIDAAHMAEFFTKMTQLRKFRLKHMEAGTDNILSALCPSLETLELYEVTIGRRETLDRLVSRCRKLKEVTMKGSEIPEKSRDLVDTFSGSNIEKLVLNRINPSRGANRSLKRSYPKLTEVFIHHASSIGGVTLLLKSAGGHLLKLNTSMLQRMTQLAYLKHCPRLKELHLSGISYMNDDTLFNALCQMSDLHVLSLTSTKATTTVTFRKLFTCTTIGQLERINLFNSHSLDQVCLRSIATGCPLLTHLDLSCCPNISLESLVEIVSKCSKLRRLDAIQCPGLELAPPDLSRIAQLQPKLVIRCARKR